jgi:sulfate adenylyltransferase
MGSALGRQPPILRGVLPRCRRRARPLPPARGRLPARSLASVAPAAAASSLTKEGLQAPHGGKLVNLMAPQDKAAALKASCTKTLELSDRNACDVELLCVG